MVGAIWPPVVQHFIETVGWRQTYFGIGLFCLAVLAVLALMAANLVGVLGWGEYFPWSVPLLFAQGKSSLTPVSYWIVFFTGLAGMLGTYVWWKVADQNR